MYKKILAAVNEYSNSLMAARYALGLAKACRAGLTLVYVAPADQVDLKVMRQAEAALEKLFLEAAAQEIEVESIIERGRPLPKIRELVREREIDLVFTATRREDLSRRFFLQTLSRELMLKLPCSVAMVRVVHLGKVHPRNILVPFRGHKRHLEEWAGFVAHLAQGWNAKVTLFHAPKSLTRFFHGEIHLRPDEREAYVSQDIEKFMERLEQQQILTEKRLGRGRAGRAITVEAASRRHDLIVMGASGRGLLHSLIFGDPVEEVLRETPCNLIVFLPRPKQA